MVKPRKVILSSATPMINSPNELPGRLNLILPEDNQMPEMDFKTVSLQTVEPYFRGLISYVRSLETGAVPVYQGEVIKKLPGRVTIQFERTLYVRKYERFEKRKTKLHARLSDCMKDEINVGDKIEIAETRPISKMIHFVVVKNITGGKEWKP